MPKRRHESPDGRLPDGQTETAATTTSSSRAITLRVNAVAHRYGVKNLWVIRHEAWMMRAKELMEFYSDDANKVADQLNIEFCRHFKTYAGEVTAVLELLEIPDLPWPSDILAEKQRRLNDPLDEPAVRLHELLKDKFKSRVGWKVSETWHAGLRYTINPQRD